MQSDPVVRKLIQAFVLRASTGTKTDPGSFSRALANSHKLAAKFSQKVRDQLHGVAEVLGKDFSNSFATQRFDSITNALRKVMLCLSSVLGFLLELAALKEEKSQWARDLLEVHCWEWPQVVFTPRPVQIEGSHTHTHTGW